MDFQLTREQELLAGTVRRFAATAYGFEARRAILRSDAGWSRDVWAQLAELGLLGLLAPEEHGGAGAGPWEVLVVMEALGPALLVEPYLPSALLATSLVRALGSPEQRAELLPALAVGARIAVPAHGEHAARYDLAHVATTAERAGDAYVLDGRKSVVLGAPAADVLLVSARTAGEIGDAAGVSLFLVPRGLAGVALEPYATLDGQRAADVTLRDVRVPAASLLGGEGGAHAAIAAAWDLGAAGLCAEAVGVLQALLDATVEYARTRRQFGQPIGRFQALQHRMADMLVCVEQARSMSFLAAARCTAADADLRQLGVSAAKVVAGDACRKVGQEAIQLHGGIGLTDELPASHLFRRLVAIERSLGDTAHHLERFRRLSVEEIT